MKTKPQEPLLKKYDRLRAYFKELGSVAVAFSGGVDSTFLLCAAAEVLKDKALAVTVSSCLIPGSEMKEAEDFCVERGIRQILLRAEPLKIEGFAANPAERCYICKKSIFSDIIKAASENGLAHVAEGSNLDDTGDYRPGMRAVEELRVKSPLKELGFTKNEIRTLSEWLGLPTWNKPSFACLASRIPYGDMITEEKLEMAGRAEELLKDHGFTQFRVRIHGNLARIELLPQEFEMFMQEETRVDLSREIKKLGFAYVTLDTIGYRTGSLNEVLR